MSLMSRTVKVDASSDKDTLRSRTRQQLTELVKGVIRRLTFIPKHVSTVFPDEDTTDDFRRPRSFRLLLGAARANACSYLGHHTESGKMSRPDNPPQNFGPVGSERRPGQHIRLHGEINDEDSERSSVVSDGRSVAGMMIISPGRA
ncbi:hypothetical protein QBC40DRAFT_253852 [Triangularia verruculosa]|uniref:Uncharacterized protein n=1 Tax=Triangularia verruculosa TaxID=2587418 RepID=A0AAN7AX86_9PEZI|nr:hypothetical protein QBC40DRAFT_253852 [Triangularia verruculosa]